MKTKILLTLILLQFMQYSCTQKESHKPVNTKTINYSDINKTLAGVSADSLVLSCSPTIFKIEKNADSTSLDTLEAFLKYSTNQCEGSGISFMVDPSGKKIKVISENETISPNSNWISNSTLSSFSLADFKGKGEKYIGYRISYVAENGFCKYGWIKIELSANSNTLRIIGNAINQNENSSILASQTR